MQCHCQGIHAIRTHVTRLKLCTSRGIGEGLFFPTPISIVYWAIPHFKFVAIAIDRVDVTILKFYCTKRQTFNTQAYCLKVITCITEHFLSILTWILVERCQDEGEKTTALFGLQSIVSGATGLLRNSHCLFFIISIKDRNWSQSHKWTIPIVELISKLTVFILVFHELTHWYFNVSSKADGMLSSSVVKSIEKP